MHTPKSPAPSTARPAMVRSRWWRSSIVATLALLASLVAGAVPAHAQVPDWAAQALPTPIADDAFFTAPADVGHFRPGEVIRSREVTIHALWLPPNRAHQIMVRSNDADDRPVAVTATLAVPTAPWAGPGPRPVVVDNEAIDSLGTTCTPSYKLVHGPVGIDLPPTLAVLLNSGYAVLVPDHEGPKMAYAAGRMAAHAVLDSIRGMKHLADVGLAGSPIAMVGYSGGAIATGWAAQLQPSYAPDVALVGAAAGGTPADLSLLQATMNGTWGSGLYLAAILGVAREYPGMLQLANPVGRLLATSPLKDQCSIVLTLAGILQVPVQALSTVADPLDQPVARKVLAENKMGDIKPDVPVYLYHGSAQIFLGDEFIPEQEAVNLQQQWCGLGANVTYQPVAGEHLIAAITGLPGMLQWISQRFAGVPAPNGCP